MGEIALTGVRRALVVGLGRSGVPAASALAAAGVEVVATDARPDRDTAPLAAAGVEVRLGVDGDDLIPLVADVDLVVPSPGVPQHAPVLLAAAERGAPVWSEPELGWRLAPRRVVAVTGTNGKTSTTQLTAAMLTAAGVDAVACGNIGHPFTVAARDAPAEALLVAELSSFQLRFAESLRPSVGVLLNLAPDHLDWHGDAVAYGRAKARLWRCQQAGDWAVGNLDDPPAAALVTAHAPAEVAWTSVGRVPDVGVGVSHGELVCRLPVHDGRLLPVERLAVAAAHHVGNVAAAACAALLAGATPDAVIGAAEDFRPGPHRLEVVAQAAGVTFVDDSKATNVHAAAAALRAFGDRPVVWIAGGRAKGVDLSPLARELRTVRHAVVIGEAAGELTAIAAGAGVTVSHAADIEQAVVVAAQVAQPGDVVLLAPACASFDQFRDYAERGDRFAAAAVAAATDRSASSRSDGGVAR